MSETGLATYWLRAAIEDAETCHEGVYVTEGEFQPCGRTAVAIAIDQTEGSTYPVCHRHTKGTAVPLTIVLAAAVEVAALPPTTPATERTAP